MNILWAGFVSHIFIFLLWTATSRGTNLKKAIPTKKHIQSVPVVVFPIFCIIQGLIPALHASITSSDFLRLVGVLCLVIGVVLASWAKIIMKQNWGKPAQHDVKTQKELVTHGPFQYSRNPIYVGLFLMFIGQQLTLGSLFLISGIIFAVVIHKAVSIEEKLLTQYFGKSYQSYAQRVPRYLMIK